MKKKAGRNYREEKEQEPDCCTCIKKKECSRYAENSYCTKWRGSEPEPEGPDPNEAWRRGDPVDF